MLVRFQETAAAADIETLPVGERANFLETLRTHRVFLRHTLRGLSEEQARERPTVSDLSVGGSLST